MFCSRCGKKINYDSVVCLECAQLLANAAKFNEPAQQPLEYRQSADMQPSGYSPTQNIPTGNSQAPVYSQQGNYSQPYQQPGYSQTQESMYAVDNSQSAAYPRTLNTSYSPIYLNNQEQVPPVDENRFFEAQENTRMIGFGGALAGLIVSTVTYIVFIIAMASVESLGAMIFLLFVSIGMASISLGMGIGAVKAFREVRAAEKPVPIATLILGICAIVNAGILLIYQLIALIALMSAA